MLTNALYALATELKFDRVTLWVPQENACARRDIVHAELRYRRSLP